DAHLGETGQKASKLRNAVFQQHRSILVLEADLHQLRQRVQPRYAVVDLKNGSSSRSEDAPAFVDEPLRVRCVLDDAVRVHQVERARRKGQLLAVFDSQIAANALLVEVRPRQLD